MTGKGSRVQVRAATASDESVLRRLYQEFHAFHVRGVPDRLLLPANPKDETFEKGVRQIFGAKDAVILVAQIDDDVVGFAEIYVRDDEATLYKPGRRYGHLQSLAVTEAVRRRGVGALLLRAAEQWATDRGAEEIRTDVWEFREGPLLFYEKAGYRTLRRTLIKRRSTPPPE